MILLEDRTLLEAYRRGRPWALERVYRYYVAAVGALLGAGFTFSSGGESYRFVGYRDEFERQEVLQQTFVNAFGERARKGYSGLSPYGPYLLGIARNLVIDDYRRRRRELALFIPERGERILEEVGERELEAAPLGTWARRPPNPEARAHATRVRALVGEFLETLDDEMVTLVDVHYLQGRSQEASAEILGLDRNGIRKRVRQLRLSLLQFMKTRGVIGSLDPKALLASLMLV
jgi:RNA polymerase sigma factor (sigma-70 family)